MQTHNAANLGLMTAAALAFAEARASWQRNGIIALTLPASEAGKLMVGWAAHSLIQSNGCLVVSIPAQWRAVIPKRSFRLASFSDYDSVQGVFDPVAQSKAAFKVLGGPQLMILLTLIPGLQCIYLHALAAAPFLCTLTLLSFHIIKQSPRLIGATTYSYHLDDETEPNTKWTLVVKLTIGDSASLDPQVLNQTIGLLATQGQLWFGVWRNEHSTQTDSWECQTTPLASLQQAMQVHGCDEFKYGRGGRRGLTCALFRAGCYHQSVAPTEDVWKAVFFFG